MCIQGFPDGGRVDTLILQLHITIHWQVYIKYEDEQGNDCSILTLVPEEEKTVRSKITEVLVRFLDQLDNINKINNIFLFYFLLVCYWLFLQIKANMFLVCLCFLVLVHCRIPEKWEYCTLNIVRLQQVIHGN